MAYGKPRLQAERCIREMTDFHVSSPNVHARLLSDYLSLSPYLDVPPQNELARPVLRHPDLSPSNILISPENDIVGLIDWQHTVVLPLCLTGGIPAAFQNYGDPVSEMMLKPEVKLPVDFDQKTTEEQAEIRETMRKRAVHFLYAAYSKTQNPANWSAISDSSSLLRSKLYHRAAQPWEGDSVPLKAALIESLQQWPPKPQGKTSFTVSASSTTPPIEYGEAEIKECLDLESRQDERISEIKVMRDSLGCDGYGHCESDQHLTFAKDMAEKIRAGILAASDTEAERKSVLEHWPFDDHDEEE